VFQYLAKIELLLYISNKHIILDILDKDRKAFGRNVELFVYIIKLPDMVKN